MRPLPDRQAHQRADCASPAEATVSALRRAGHSTHIVTRAVFSLQSRSNPKTIDQFGPALQRPFHLFGSLALFRSCRRLFVGLAISAPIAIGEESILTSMTVASFSTATTIPVITGMARCFLNSKPV